jgi:hypothetical protein
MRMNRLISDKIFEQLGVRPKVRAIQAIVHQMDTKLRANLHEEICSEAEPEYPGCEIATAIELKVDDIKSAAFQMQMAGCDPDIIDEQAEWIEEWLNDLKLLTAVLLEESDLQYGPLLDHELTPSKNSPQA